MTEKILGGSSLVGVGFASAWMTYLLRWVRFHLSGKKMTRATADRLGPKVCFQTGKPPCFLGSWTSFAFTHHLIVCGGVSRTVGLKHMQFGALTLSSPVRK